MSGGLPTSGSSPPPPPRTLFLSLAACMFAVSFAVLLVTAFAFCCRWRRGRGSRLPGGHCGGEPSFPAVETMLPSFPYAPEDDDDGPRECAVCLGPVTEGETVRRLPACRHLYHLACIDRWLAAHRTCPVCRSQLDSFKAEVASSSSGPGAERSTHPPDQSPV
ncbi:hypothetical protein PAHAL_4G122100 [Panicum hallii]|uniref:RING-type E3 ubiquitin transferase n=1 Tax=Panicum hallii TaxID=206008 RepID=A0A2S3HIW2_9POAL|nr:RING-H2 finger protein ATL74-like [Panicum hallii]PAN23835.1 hypothetical protein PAHAL_4G122100 [Panicum hallii]